MRIFLENIHSYYCNILVLTSDKGSYNFSSNVEVRTIDFIQSRRDYQKHIFRWITDYQPDIIWNIIPAGMYYILSPAKKFGKAKLINGMRSIYKLNRIKRVLQWIGYWQSNAITSNVHPDDMIPAFRYVYTKKNGYYIPNALSHDLEIKPFSSSKTNIKILYAGRLISDKNLKVLIKAVKVVKNDIPKVKLLICGEGNERNSLESFTIKLDLTDNIEFLGYRTDLKSIMAQCNLLVLPSIREGMPNIAFEATQEGLPLLLSRISAHSRWFTHLESAYLFNKTNINDLATGIKYSIDNQNANKLVLEAQKLLSHLSKDKMIENYINLFKVLVNEG